jgi:predicted nucleic acid-binding protein
MLLVVADTSPIRYLVQIGHIDLLPRLFEKLLVPGIVADELRHPSAPQAVRSWMKEPPAWFEILPAPAMDDTELQGLDPGESAAIALGLSRKANLILIDERKGAAVATSQRIRNDRNSGRSRFGRAPGAR